MLQSILEKSRGTDYDFRRTAHPEDPLAHLFNDWVAYYKLKWAVAHVLKPASILEIGVRFGYSAAAFLNGHPTARYLGIDLDSDSYGGVKGAIHWAREITRQFSSAFVIADTQTMDRLPGGVYDLIHVDGQQDGDGTFHDLELAIRQARHVLMDGYFWTRQNFMAVNEFLFRHAHVLEFFGVIPGYAGELLIRVSDAHIHRTGRHEPGNADSSLALRTTYTPEYYLMDCGGFDAFKLTRGKRLEDPRLQAVAAIAGVKRGGRALDLGCGRGELAYHLASQGFSVTAVDYAPSAIELARECFRDDDSLKARVELLCADVCGVPLEGEYDLVVASDLIEHLSPAEADRLYARIAGHLAHDGLFVLHTFPNLWFYRYDYPRKRRIAASVGAYLPPDPRPRYERLMHINEQSPRVLRRELGSHFEHARVWFGDVFNPGGSLVRRFSKGEMRAAPDLFAVASHVEYDREVAARLQMTPLPPVPSGQVFLTVRECPAQVPRMGEFQASVEIANRSAHVLSSFPPNPVHVAYHWMDERGVETIVFEGLRSKIFPLLDPNTSACVRATIRAPEGPGRRVLRLTLVQEAVRWFDQAPELVAEDLALVVR